MEVVGAMAVLTGTEVSIGVLVLTDSGISVDVSVGDHDSMFIAFVGAVSVVSIFLVLHPDKSKEKINIKLIIKKFFMGNDSL